MQKGIKNKQVLHNFFRSRFAEVWENLESLEAVEANAKCYSGFIHLSLGAGGRNVGRA